MPVNNIYDKNHYPANQACLNCRLCNFMKRYIFIVATILFLGSSTELHELARIPALLKHYTSHLSEDPSLSLLDFLKLHYTGNHPNDNDESEDQGLPFKSGENIIHPDIPLVKITGSDDNPVNYFTGKAITCHPEGALLQRSVSIFHPPRLA